MHYIKQTKYNLAADSKCKEKVTKQPREFITRESWKTISLGSVCTCDATKNTVQK
jgi:hypothetical protein